jgi:hypothetical protein
MIRRLRRVGRLAAVVPVCVLVALGTAALAPKVALANHDAVRHRSHRLTTALRTWASREDCVVALDVAGYLASYVVQRSGLSLPVERFPRERLDGLDDVSRNGRVTSGMAGFRREAVNLAERANGHRIWLIGSPIYEDVQKPRHPYEALRLTLLAELRHHVPRAGPPAPELRELGVWLIDPQ